MRLRFKVCFNINLLIKHYSNAIQDIQRNIRFEELCPPKRTHLYKSPEILLRGHTL